MEWFLPKADAFFRVLKPSGTFILNIKERVVNGERHTYVIELILEMQRRNWLWNEEYVRLAEARLRKVQPGMPGIADRGREYSVSAMGKEQEQLYESS